MPEGPEIRRAADRIAKVVQGRVIERVEFGLPRLQEFEGMLSGVKVNELETRGKALLTHFDNDLTLYSHNQLYGRWYVVKRDRLPKTNRSLRVALHTETHSALLYSASDIEVLTADELTTHKFLARIGPDILSQQLTPQRVVQQLEDAKFSGRKLAHLYLDQGFFAGVGNYLRSEILFEARVNPNLRPKDLSPAQHMALGEATIEISKRAYKTAGITNDLERVAQLKEQGVKRSQFRHHVFARQSRRCYECGTKVTKVELSGRRLYYCASCQSVPE
ncbi:MAG: endonuclease VIII [Aequoribacter sp.]|uniref:endonuclease VIII n=1 Tax=Aequoribacter sp. TaxID=2847771 RepID=UPI003C5F80D7